MRLSWICHCLRNAESGTDVRLRVKAQGQPFAAARSLCEPFYLDYGSTIGLPIKVVEPTKGSATKFDEVYARGYRVDKLLALLALPPKLLLGRQRHLLSRQC